MVTIESKGVNTFGSKFNIAAFVVRMPNSPLLIPTSPSAIGNQNGGCDTGYTLHMEYM